MQASINNSLKIVRAGVVAILCAALIAGCDDKPETGPYFEFVGGGFIFNIRSAEAYYGFVAKIVRDVPDGTHIEAEFENPSGDAPFVFEALSAKTQRSYRFETPPLAGIRADRDYWVELRLLDAADGHVIARQRKAFQSSLDHDVLPKTPPVVGPGYQPNPAATPRRE